jgi:hypothetical protein
MQSNKTNLSLALFCIALALLTAFVWVPADTATGLVEKVRRQVTIGDALAPALAACFIGLGGLLVLLERGADRTSRLGLDHLRFLLMLLALFAAVFGVMRWAGPAAAFLAGLLTGEEFSYRALRDTAPWKYIGYFLGCSGLITVLISAIEGRLSRRALLTGVIAACVLIAIYDLPFDDLLLPPNGDV